MQYKRNVIRFRSFISDWELLNNEEKVFISNPWTHVDFLIINHASKKPILAIEIDGYSYHNKFSTQYRRDLIKNKIFELYNISLLRLNTIGSNEKKKNS